MGLKVPVSKYLQNVYFVDLAHDHFCNQYIIQGEVCSFVSRLQVIGSFSDKVFN